jgi:hypothetical protein
MKGGAWIETKINYGLSLQEHFKKNSYKDDTM